MVPSTPDLWSTPLLVAFHVTRLFLLLLLLGLGVRSSEASDEA